MPKVKIGGRYYAIAGSAKDWREPRAAKKHPRHFRGHRRWAKKLKAKREAQLRERATRCELLVLNALRALHSPHIFQRGFVCRGSVRVVDFLLTADDIIIEVDGDSHNGREAEDFNRTLEICDTGYGRRLSVLRITNDQVLAHSAGLEQWLLRQIYETKVAAIQARSTAPEPSSPPPATIVQAAPPSPGS